jgi:light-regulated signal transduction histidine kinase (bacteriophytochrome)
MGQLIDDLLRLARITRNALERETVDLSEMATAIAAELKSARPECRVAFIISPGITASADRRLIRIALENLFGNGMKFAAGRPDARIEFGVEENGGEKAFFVRDNGVGFDMAYSDRLFIPFQRLHSQAEYPGSGIGLATVRRIIQRHGGDIWAQGEEEKGATFFFTL